MSLVFLCLVLFSPLSVLRGQLKRISFQEANQILDKLDLNVQADSALILSEQVFFNGDPAGSRNVIERVIPFAEKAGNARLLSSVYFQLSKIADLEKNYRLATNEGLKALNYARNESDPNYARIVFFLGRYYQRMEKLDSMLYYYDLFESYNSRHDPYNNWKIYESKNEMYVQKGEYDQAYENILKAYELTRTKPASPDHGVVLYRLLQLTIRMNKPDLYGRFLREYVDISKKYQRKPSIHGLPLVLEGKPNQQLNTCLKLIRECESIEYPALMANLYHKTSMLYQEVKDYPNALFYLEKIDTSALSISAKMDYLQEKYQIQKQMHHIEEALISLEKQQWIKDSLTNVDRVRQLRELDARYESSKMEKQINLLNKLDEANQLSLNQAKREKKLLWSVLILSLLLLGTLVVFWQKNKRKNSLLSEKNATIQKALDEKEILLKEIHHRVKNNLQVVSSILTLQSNYSKDPLVYHALNDGKNRVASMALIHKNLYNEDHLTTIHSKKYFEDLIEQIEDTYLVPDHPIAIQSDIESLYIDVESMIPLGLIANECISNSFKHAFPRQLSGLITITLKKVNTQLVLTIRDNGMGLDKEAFFSSKSFGNKIISTFAEKLNASLDIKNEDGTEFRLSFEPRSWA